MDFETTHLNNISMNIGTLPKWARSDKKYRTPRSNNTMNQENVLLNSAKTPYKTPISSSTLHHKTPHSRCSTRKTPLTSDRFIPSQVNSEAILSNDENKQKTEFSGLLADSLLRKDSNRKILGFQNKSSSGHSQQIYNSISRNSSKAENFRKDTRSIPLSPEKILDAPGIVDDYYLNVLDWSRSNNVAIALGSSLYLWNPTDGNAVSFLTLNDNEIITSVQFTSDSSHIAIGTSDNVVQLWDIKKQAQVRSLQGHKERVASLAWNQFLLASGSRDSTIFIHDVRARKHHVATLIGHKQEICGLKWSNDGANLASGGNDNLCCIYDLACLFDKSKCLDNVTNPINPLFKLEHESAVKALAWCPRESRLLATGGGTADKKIRFFSNGKLVKTLPTNSQVTSLVWNPHEEEFVSGHGFSSNQLIVWNYRKEDTILQLHKLQTLTGHTSRILHLALSPDATTVCSAAADETIRFWKVFEGSKKPTGKNITQTLLNKDRIPQLR